MRRQASACLAAAALAVAVGCSRAETPLTPEAARAKGDAMLRQMSQTVGSTQTFSYSTDEVREHVRPGGAKVENRFSRQVFVRRPNALAFVQKGQDRDSAAWYDGKQVTLVTHYNKTWARGPMPATLDEAMDFVSAEYAIQLPTADLLYSSPYDALMTADTTGGWVKVDKVDVRTCEHLSYSQSVVDWQIWLTQDDRRLPCQFQITYKTEPSQPVTRVTFHDWNQAPQVSDATFTATIPDGYQRLKMMRHATVEDPTVEEASAPPASGEEPAGAPKKQPQ